MPRLLSVIVLVCAAVALRAATDREQGSSRPNLEGTWNSATATPLERPAQLKDKPFFTPAEAAEWERQYAERNASPHLDTLTCEGRT